LVNCVCFCMCLGERGGWHYFAFLCFS
jgi:hypothetical protein